MTDNQRRILRTVILVAGIKLVTLGTVGVIIGAVLIWIYELGNSKWD